MALSHAPAAPHTGAPAPAGRRPGLGLEWRLNVLIGSLMLGIVALLAWQQVQATRASVREEMVASHRVATQLLQRVGWVLTRSGPGGMLSFLEQLGRVRAQDVRLISVDGELLYRSPPSPYKPGRNAPDWYTELVGPPAQSQEVALPGARLIVEADPSRAILDGWDELVRLAAFAAAVCVAVLGALFAMVRHTLRPLRTIVQGLERLQAGDYAAHLPALPGREAALIGDAVNQLGRTLGDQIEQRVQALETERRLAESREWAQRVEQRLEAERRQIAGELHDELGQSVTAIRSLARSLGARLPEADPVGREAARLIDREAAQLYDAMHGLIPRLTPLALDPQGLPEALADLLASLRQRHPGVNLGLSVTDMQGVALSPPVALAVYRVAQEAVNNALKHSGASHIELRLARDAQGRVSLDVDDDGCGLPPADARRGRFGLTGLRERVTALGGHFEAGRREGGGTRVQARLPCEAGEPPS